MQHPQPVPLTTLVVGAAVAAASLLLVLPRLRKRPQLRPPAADEPFELLLSGVVAAASDVHVVLHPHADRRPHHTMDARLEAVWQERLAAAASSGGKLFDATKFRLHRIRPDPGQRGAVRLELGLTSYKQYVGTNQLPRAQRALLEADGIGDFNDRDAHLSNALGCETVLLTSDEQAVLLRRSARVSAFTGLYNGPSGHAEPENARISAHGKDGADRCARDELFGAMVQEVIDETNVPRQALSAPRLIGAMCDASRKPDVLFVMRTSLDAEGVRHAYARGAVEGWESDRLAFWPARRLDECTLPLTPVTRAAFACLQAAGGVEAAPPLRDSHQ